MSQVAELIEQRDEAIALIGKIFSLYNSMHTPSPSTAGCAGGIGGQAITAHCAETCNEYTLRHGRELDEWRELYREFTLLNETKDYWT